MGCVWSSKSSKRCSVCNCKESRDSDFRNNICRRCAFATIQCRRSRTLQHHETISSFVNTSIPNENRSYGSVRRVPPQTSLKPRPILPQPRPILPQPRPISSQPRPISSQPKRKLPEPRLNTTSNKPQFGEYYCKPCGRSWVSLRSWSTKYQMCKRCKNPVYPHKLRMLLSSDYSSTVEDPKVHEKELCQMCKHLGYDCKNYDKNVKRR